MSEKQPIVLDDNEDNENRRLKKIVRGLGIGVVGAGVSATVALGLAVETSGHDVTARETGSMTDSKRRALEDDAVLRYATENHNEVVQEGLSIYDIKDRLKTPEQPRHVETPSNIHTETSRNPHLSSTNVERAPSVARTPDIANIPNTVRIKDSYNG